MGRVNPAQTPCGGEETARTGREEEEEEEGSYLLGQLSFHFLLQPSQQEGAQHFV